MTTVQVIAPARHAGLARDQALIARTLAAAGFAVTLTTVGQGGLARRLGAWRLRARLGWARRHDLAHGRFDVNLMLERLQPQLLPLARRNALIPNPEWFDPAWDAQLAGIDRVLVKTHHAESLFAALHARVDYIGFTSEDRRLTQVEREDTFFHLAGRSGNKGTQPLIDLWARKPFWPTLTIVRRAGQAHAPAAPNLRFIGGFVDDEALQLLQNRHRLHLCPSETEGFGHYLVEATSVGAVVLTTQAPPMDELVDATRGILVPYARSGMQRLATTYFVDEAGLEHGIARMLALSAAERDRLGEQARAWYEANDRAFRTRLVDAVGRLAAS